MRARSIAVLTIAGLIGSQGVAHAYLDPGTASMVLQVVLSVVVGIGVGAKLYWHRLMFLLGVKKQRTSEDES